MSRSHTTILTWPQIMIAMEAELPLQGGRQAHIHSHSNLSSYLNISIAAVGVIRKSSCCLMKQRSNAFKSQCAISFAFSRAERHNQQKNAVLKNVLARKKV